MHGRVAQAHLVRSKASPLLLPHNCKQQASCKGRISFSGCKIVYMFCPRVGLALQQASGSGMIRCG
jgi:hypothetical protein